MLGCAKALAPIPILLYHRVCRLRTDPQLLAVTPAHFAEQMAWLADYCRPLTLAEFVRARDEGGWPERGIVVTFDDGYADNLEEATPILQRYGIPATFFVCTDGVGHGEEFWWDELERVVLLAPRLPERLSLELEGGLRTWPLGAASGPDPEAATWNVEVPQDPSPRHRAYRELHALIRPLSDAARRTVLEQLRLQAGTLACAARNSHRPLGPDEIRVLAGGRGVEIGAHTLTHPVLRWLPPEDQEREVGECKRRLEGIIGREVFSFSYPFGGRSDWDETTAAVVRRCGYACAVTTLPGAAVPGSDVYELPRVLVRDWTGPDLERRLGECWGN
jgi:peptidoglycan/xylan/chitin deacetylase (PgdA/CDA1 family)